MWYIDLIYRSLRQVCLAQNMELQLPQDYSTGVPNLEFYPFQDHRFQTFHRSFRTQDWCVHIYVGRGTQRIGRSPGFIKKIYKTVYDRNKYKIM